MALSFKFAKRVMTIQDYSISDIALHLGYADASQLKERLSERTE
ncbi:hypothetical protein EDB69_2349 [Vibrio crassostreae]|nr:hypothetical protein EDB64_1908 [Vibrio crassostreae]ROP10389.1 hypothetical protein EDB63_2104 [Vibrio crassostreae]ROQ80058.1 hypothetical protein EDB72_2754 [Vibrio crassostreae]ROR85229.1 hypothetical protein EDB66_2096 [Vibrio crassostreae]RPE93150.1 hypothetical protein EDB68_2108 [Vibrio crassostreae]